jgi:hypothetical protein
MYQARLGGRQQERNKPVLVQLWDKQLGKELPKINGSSTCSVI